MNESQKINLKTILSINQIQDNLLFFLIRLPSENIFNLTECFKHLNITKLKLL